MGALQSSPSWAIVSGCTRLYIIHQILALIVDAVLSVNPPCREPNFNIDGMDDIVTVKCAQSPPSWAAVFGCMRPHQDIVASVVDVVLVAIGG